MPKMKTKSAAKKRFSITATGKAKAKHAGKRHCMRRRSQKQVRNLRAPAILEGAEARFVKQYLKAM